MSNTDNKTRALFGDIGTDLLVEKDEQRRCMGCMEEFSTEFDLCPNCGYVIGTQPRLKCYLQPGLWLAGNYMLGKVIGQGGFGITYIAWDKKNERKVAVKEFFPNSLSTRETGETHVICYNDKAEIYFKDGVKKMLEEGVRLSSFRENENIVTVYDYFEENDTAYIVMEYLEGKSLKDYADEKGGKLDPEEAVTLILPVLNALSAMHNENLIHRDVAPDNIYLCDDGKIKLLDFGSARIAVQDANKSLSVMVKPGYAPKEQYVSRSKQGPWTDVYSVCATLYKLITGEAPVESVERDITPLKTFESFGIQGCEKLEDIITVGLNPEPEERISSAEELKNWLEEDYLNADVACCENSAKVSVANVRLWETLNIVSFASCWFKPLLGLFSEFLSVWSRGYMLFDSVFSIVFVVSGAVLWRKTSFAQGLSDVKKRLLKAGIIISDIAICFWRVFPLLYSAYYAFFVY